MNSTEPEEEILLRCPSPLDCAECDDAVDCLSEIIRKLFPAQQRALLRVLADECPS